jgi:hypothetical protein
MPERVEPFIALGESLQWEPNAPEAVLVSDDEGRAALAVRAHPDDPDQRCVVLRWDFAIVSTLGAPNDEGLHEHRLFEKGLRDLLWLGVVRDSVLVDQLRPMWHRVGDRYALPMHFVLPLKECVVEVVAENVDVFRIDGHPRNAAPASFDPPVQ